MIKIQITILSLLLLSQCVFAQTDHREKKQSQKQSRTAAIENDIRKFYDEYAEDLRQHRRAAIADRYDRRGVYLLGNGEKTLESFAAVSDYYLTKWKGPKSFAWKDLSIEVLSPTAVVVVGLFDWQQETGNTATMSYTGVLLKQAGKWRIRVEDESAAIVKSSAGM